ncbi:hypothetical protein J4573_00450 [Actinomadura barringtoniae]|uniref:Uncharacterized protein n=1 Tax=Actinomadura barringtoniae TaxID=1427535 RepID=A0A939P5J6_9ACTN|nr:hypothetical protein [Actinomadura barringtoniae]MBO2445550.1 hypothetical protein [Actinomadura barringtoniae]
MSDIFGEVLQRAFAERGFRTTMIEWDTLEITKPGMDPWTIHIDAFRQSASVNSRAELPRLAADYVERAVAAFTRDTAGIDEILAAGQLRLRLYHPDDLGDLRDSLVARPLAPGLLETVVIDYPESLSPLQRSALGNLSENEAFGAAILWSLDREPHYVQTDEVYGVPITYVGEQHRYVSAHLHLLLRHVNGHAPFGALVAVPIPEYVIIHVIGPDAHLFAAMEAMQDLARTHYEKGEKPLTKQVYWWCPGDYERIPVPDAFHSGMLPDLRPVGLEFDHEEETASPLTPYTDDLVALWMEAHP